MPGPILYIAEVDYPPEHHAPHGKWNDWYAHRHAPDLFKLGARSVASYRPVVGGLAALNVYEIPDADILRSPAYAAMTPKDPYAQETRDLSAGRKRAQTLYLERKVWPADEGPLDADWIAVLRFAVPEAEDGALVAWLEEEARGLLQNHGVRTRYATRIEQSVGAGSFRPRCVIFAEWKAQPPEVGELLPSLQERFGAMITEPERFVGWRAYPWPDAKRAWPPAT
jgi:hypothetical protein